MTSRLSGLFGKNRRQDEYFNLFQELGRIQHKSSSLLSEAVKNLGKQDFTEQSTEIEHEGDRVASSIFQRLNTVFIAPLDRDEIFYLTHALDDVIDKTDEVISNIKVCGITNGTEAIEMFAKLISDSSYYLFHMLTRLGNKHAQDINELRECIHRTESAGDDLYEEEMTRLFTGTRDAVELRRQERIIESFEDALDARQKACDIIMGIHVKWS